MDYKGFKKVHEDDDKAILKNKHGHSLTIAKKVLSSKHLAGLKNLPLHKADGGRISHYDDGGTVEGRKIQEQDAEIDARDAEAQTRADANQPRKLVDNQPGTDSSKPINININPAPAASAPEYQQAATNVPEMPTGENPQGIPLATAAPYNGPAITPPTPPHKPAQSQPSIPAAQAEPAAPTAPAPVSQAQMGYDEYRAAHAREFGQQAAAYEQDLQNGHITPETYSSLFGKKDTLGKIGTLFGLMLSGAGSGITGQPNAVLQMMNNEINNDLEAQKNSKLNAQNFLRINQEGDFNRARIIQLRKEGKLTDAGVEGAKLDNISKSITNAKNNILLSTINHLQGINEKLPDGDTKNKATQLLGGVQQAAYQEIGNNNEKTATALANNREADHDNNVNAYRMMSLLGQPGAEQALQYEQDHSVPGMGTTKIAVSPDVRAQFAAQQQYDEKAREYVEFAKKHSANWANLNPIQREAIANQGAAMAANLQSLYRNKIKGGVYKKGEQEFIEQIIPDQPAKWSASFNAIPKVMQTIKDNAADIENTKNMVGMNPYTDKKQNKSTQEEPATIERWDPKSKKTIVYDATTKKPLRAK